MKQGLCYRKCHARTFSTLNANAGREGGRRFAAKLSLASFHSSFIFDAIKIRLTRSLKCATSPQISTSGICGVTLLQDVAQWAIAYDTCNGYQEATQESEQDQRTRRNSHTITIIDSNQVRCQQQFGRRCIREKRPAASTHTNEVRRAFKSWLEPPCFTDPRQAPDRYSSLIQVFECLYNTAVAPVVVHEVRSRVLA